MRLLGTIKLVQVQRDRLKRGEKPDRTYETAPLLPVQALRLTPTGVIGLAGEGIEVIDVHNAMHPNTRNRDNANSVSIGFVTNYDRMRQRFGEHLFDGCAGENLIIEQSDDFSMSHIDSRLVIEQTTGEQIRLFDVGVIPPCAEFSAFCAQQRIGGEELRLALQFLADGTRGFYATLEPQQGQPVIQPGDRLYAV
ncbi:MAG: hypothetical protein ACOCYT_05230 [Chloroflexota bacterium]